MNNKAPPDAPPVAVPGVTAPDVSAPTVREGVPLAPTRAQDPKHGLFRGTSRLITQIYLFGLATIITVALLGFSAAAVMFRDRAPRKPPLESMGQLILDRVAADAATMPLDQALKRASDQFDIHVGLFDAQGNLVHSSGAPMPQSAEEFPPWGPPEEGPPPPPISEADGEFPPGPPVAWISVNGIPGVSLGRVEFHLPKPDRHGPPTYMFVAALVVLAVTSFLFSRWLGKPLSTLSRAVAAFGSGDFSARARLKRTDELGALGETFDQMAERISALVTAQKELVANVSHELRTPISRIRVALDIAALGDATSAAAQLEGISGDLAELEDLLESVMVSSRLDLASQSGSIPIRLTETQPEGVLQEAIQRFGTMHPKRLLTPVLEGPLPVIQADPKLLRRVVDNLLQNAARYSEPDTEITLRAVAEKGDLRVQVEDSGMGIGAEDIERVFEPFYRTDPSRTRSTGGTGLGLTLARRVVEAHKGSIWLRSEPGKGTQVCFSIPGQHTSTHDVTGKSELDR